MNAAQGAAAPQKDVDRGDVVELYEELRRWALQPAGNMPPQSRRLGQAILLRSGLGEWMATVASLQRAGDQATTSAARPPSALPSSTRAQLAAALANVVLTRLEEVPHEP